MAKRKFAQSLEGIRISRNESASFRESVFAGFNKRPGDYMRLCSSMLRLLQLNSINSSAENFQRVSHLLRNFATVLEGLISGSDNIGENRQGCSWGQTAVMQKRSRLHDR